MSREAALKAWKTRRANGSNKFVKSKTSDSIAAIVNRFIEIDYDADKIRGLKRAITLYCQNQNAEPGSKERDYIYRVIKAGITRRGEDHSVLNLG